LTAFDRFSAQAKDALVADVARQFDPPPAAQLLARLQWIATDANRPAITQIYLANLRSPDAQARRASLQGLETLGYPQLTDVALAALRDGADAVVGAAAQMLLPLAQREGRVRGLLGGVAAAHRDDPDFHVTTSLLSAHGIGEPS
jgi:hypothetical protein